MARTLSCSAIAATILVAATAATATMLPWQRATAETLSTKLYLRQRKSVAGTGMSYSFNYTSNDTLAATAEVGVNVGGWLMGKYAPDAGLLHNSTNAAYFAVGYAQGFVEAQQVWDQWRLSSEANYKLIVANANRTHTEAWKFAAFENMLKNIQAATATVHFHDSDFDASRSKQHSMLEGRRQGHNAAIVQSSETAHHWIHGGSPAEATLSFTQLFFMTVEDELMAAETVARIRSENDVTYDNYRPWTLHANWTNATANRDGGKCVLKRVADDLLLGQSSEANFNDGVQRVMRIYEFEEAATFTGKPGSHGGSDAWILTSRDLAFCGAPIKVLAPKYFENVNTDATHVPATMAKWWASFTATSTRDFFTRASHNLMGMDPTTWTAVDFHDFNNGTIRAHGIVAGDIIPGTLPTPKDLSADPNATIVAAGRPILQAVREGHACAWCAQADKVYGFLDEHAAEFVADAVDGETMMAALRNNSWRTTNMSVPPRPLTAQMRCAGIAPSPRFDLNPTNATAWRLPYEDKNCVRKGYGAVDAKVTTYKMSPAARSVNVTAAGNNRDVVMLAMMGPVYENEDTPAFNPVAFYCVGNNTGSRCVSGLIFGSRSSLRFAPVNFNMTVSKTAPAATVAPPTPAPPAPSVNPERKITTADVLIALAAAIAVFAVLALVCVATQPSTMPKSAIPQENLA